MSAARKIQLTRYAELGLDGVVCNARAPASLVEEIANADAAGMALLRDAAERLRLSARGYHRVLKLARTLADLDGGGPTVVRIWPKRSPTGDAGPRGGVTMSGAQTRTIGSNSAKES